MEKAKQDLEYNKQYVGELHKEVYNSNKSVIFFTDSRKENTYLLMPSDVYKIKNISVTKNELK